MLPAEYASEYHKIKNEWQRKVITIGIENDLVIINLKDAASPVLIKDLSDKNSFHVVMPMKI